MEMTRNLNAFCLMCIVSGVFASVNQTGKEEFITTAGSLKDRDWMTWIDCEKNENCVRRRLHSCASNRTNARIACGAKIWKEEMQDCYTCSSGWIPETTDWSNCDGTGCGDTTQTMIEACGNMAVNPSCKRVLTRYCMPKDICDGTWSSWTSNNEPCRVTCETVRSRSITRTCMKNGYESGNCDNSQKPYIFTKLERCQPKSCITTAAATTTQTTTYRSTTTKEPTTTATSTTTTTTTTTTTKRPAAITNWSTWSKCNTTCAQKNAIQTRTRKCVYKNNGEPANANECPRIKTQEKTCQLQDDSICSTTQAEQSTSTKVITTAEVQTAKPRILPNFERVIATKATHQNTTASTSDINESGLTKEQYHILVIALGTAASLLVLIVIIYLACSKRSGKRKRRRKLGEISVVALESHTGFMEGMEEYGFKSSMMPTDGLLASIRPPEVENNVNSELASVQQNQNSHHVYEDMRLPTTEVPNLKPTGASQVSRSASQRERTANNSQYDVMRRRRSCFVGTQDTPRKKAPPKPPRRSMPQLDIPHRYELSERPDTAHEDHSPALDFIQQIRPPSTTPPRTPQPNFQNTQIPQAPPKSAPVSPGNFSMNTLYAAQIPFINCVPGSLLVPYGNISMMAPMVQSGSGEVIYMHSLTPMHHVNVRTGLVARHSAVLHGTAENANTQEQRLRPTPKPRPHSTGILPMVSLTDVASVDTLAPQIVENTNTSRIASHLNDAGSTPYQLRSFKHLHGTQEIDISATRESLAEDKINNNKIEIPEDANGYVVACNEE